MQESNHDLLTRVVGYLVGFVGLGGLAGYLQYRLAARRAPADANLVTAQADVQHATAEEMRARVRREDENATVANLRAVTQELRIDIERLRQRAEAAEGEVVRLLQEQKKRHRLINELSAYRMRDQLIRAGMSYEEAQREPVEPLYPEEDTEG